MHGVLIFLVVSFLIAALSYSHYQYLAGLCEITQKRSNFLFIKKIHCSLQVLTAMQM